MRTKSVSPRVLNPAYTDLRTMVHRRAIDAFKNAQFARSNRAQNRYQESIYQISVFAASNASTALCSLIEGTSESYARVEAIIKGWRDIAQRDIDYYLALGGHKTAVYFQLEKAHCVRMLRLLKQLR